MEDGSSSSPPRDFSISFHEVTILEELPTLWNPKSADNNRVATENVILENNCVENAINYEERNVFRNKIQSVAEIQQGSSFRSPMFYPPGRVSYPHVLVRQLEFKSFFFLLVLWKIFSELIPFDNLKIQIRLNDFNHLAEFPVFWKITFIISATKLSSWNRWCGKIRKIPFREVNISEDAQSPLIQNLPSRHFFARYPRTISFLQPESLPPERSPFP
jgi:hypothetical protein